MDDVMSIAEQYFERRYIWIAGNLELHYWMNTTHHHILRLLEGGVIEDVNNVHENISTELPSSRKDRELFDLVKKYSMHRKYLTVH